MKANYIENRRIQKKKAGTDGVRCRPSLALLDKRCLLWIRGDYGQYIMIASGLTSKRCRIDAEMMQEMGRRTGLTCDR